MGKPNETKRPRSEMRSVRVRSFDVRINILTMNDDGLRLCLRSRALR